MTSKPRDCVRGYFGGKPNRPAVVLRFGATHAILATGTTIDRSAMKNIVTVRMDDDGVDVDSWIFGKQWAWEMGLDKPTWFTTNDLEPVLIASLDGLVTRYCGPCPEDVFEALLEMCGI